MKEIGIEKLIELLNEFEDYKEKEYGYANYDWKLHEISNGEKRERWITAFRIDESELGVEESIAVIICKGYGFCEWLVENDKIDISKIKCGYVYNDTEEDKVKNVIMNLSISDTPIEDLISYLK